MALCEIDFSEILTHLRRNIVELELAIDFFFGAAGDRFFSFKRGEAVFIERISHLERSLAQGNVVRLRPREVLHGSAERFRRKKPHVDLHPTAEMEADLVIAASNDIHDRRIFRDICNRLLTTFFAAARLASDQDVEVANRFASAAQRPGGSDLVDALELLNVGSQFLTFEFSSVNQESTTDAAIILDRL